MGYAVIPLKGRSDGLQFGLPLNKSVWLIDNPHAEPAIDRAVLRSSGDEAGGFGLYLDLTCDLDAVQNSIVLPESLRYLQPGDVIAISDDGKKVSVLWRTASAQNSLLLTERCDNYCVMCSQPPKQKNDDWLLDRAKQVISLLPSDTEGLTFTGGEPTIHGSKFTSLIEFTTTRLPETQIHILSNGRRFTDVDFATAYAQSTNNNVMVGIPVYGSEPSLHDYIVQADNAFNETIEGILNLAELNQRIEIRVVIQQGTAQALPAIAHFIIRNLPFVDQVALMGLEYMGLAKANFGHIHIDPCDYRTELYEATTSLHNAGIKTMIYNHQLCLIDQRIWPFAVKAISDWKNEYLLQCGGCAVLDRCGGFFSSTVERPSQNIKPIQESVPHHSESVHVHFRNIDLERN